MNTNNAVSANHEDCFLCSTPIDEFARIAFDIKPEEVEQYTSVEYAGMHTSKILKLILQNRNRIQAPAM
ncbi:MAG: hypothetical protein FWC89_04630 [Defluviitaleaceae bacterium]|nr:hypothetical protein [Defluviitaleaceae bacterium]